MARQILQVGTTANDGTGDTLRAAMIKVNDTIHLCWQVVSQSEATK